MTKAEHVSKILEFYFYNSLLELSTIWRWFWFMHVGGGSNMSFCQINIHDNSGILIKISCNDTWDIWVKFCKHIDRKKKKQTSYFDCFILCNWTEMGSLVGTEQKQHKIGKLKLAKAAIAKVTAQSMPEKCSGNKAKRASFWESDAPNKWFFTGQAVKRQTHTFVLKIMMVRHDF